MKPVSALLKTFQKRNTGLRFLGSFINTSLRKVAPIVLGEGGNQRFILVTIYEHGASGINKTIMRGSNGNHTEIYKITRNEIANQGLCTQCLGGGKLDIEDESKTITVYGNSKTFGKADPDQTRTILRRKFKEYKISFDDERTD